MEVLQLDSSQQVPLCRCAMAQLQVILQTQLLWHIMPLLIDTTPDSDMRSSS